MSRFGFPHLKLISIILTFFTGFTALIFQNTWHRYLNYLLGSQSQATAMILAVFLGGMSIGYFIYGHLTQKFPRSLFKLYGITELLIGVWAIFSPVIFRAVSDFEIDGFLAELGVSLIFLGPPTILMGGTIPVLTQTLSRDLKSSTRTHSQVYSFNTLGAALGSFLAGFYFLPTFGLAVSLFYMGSINVSVGIIFYLLDETLQLEKKELTNLSLPEEKPKAFPIKWLWVIVFISGFVTLGLEALLIRMVGLSIGSSTYTFSIIVGIFVFCIALGGWVVGTFKKISIQAIGYLLGLTGISLLILYNSIETWPYYSQTIRAVFSNSPYAFSPYFATISLAFAGALLIPILLCGAALPLCFNFAKRSVDSLGSNTGTLYALNTLGCVSGALLAGYYLLLWCNLNEVFLLLIYMVAFSGLLSLGFSWNRVGNTSRLRLLVVFFIFLTILSRQSPWENHLFSIGTFRDRGAPPPTFEAFKTTINKNESWFYRDGPAATVAVISTPGSQDLSILINGKAEANTSGDLATMQLLSHIPILLTENPENVCVIGFGSGITAGVAGQYKEVRQIDLIEINPVVIEAGKLFETFNYHALSNPKTRVVITDAFRHLRNGTKKYDTIISEPSNPWMFGVANLFTQEFFQLISDRLSMNGVFFQWFHGYSLSLNTVRLIMSTFQTVFPHYYVFQTQETDFGILGSKTPISNERLKVMAQRLSREGKNQALMDFGATDIESFLALETISGRAIELFTEGGGWHTLENPKLDYWAGKDFFTRANAPVAQVGNKDPFIVNEVSLLKQWEAFVEQKKDIQLPPAYCAKSFSLCRRLDLRNYFLNPESPESKKYLANATKSDQEILTLLLKKEVPVPPEKEKAKKLATDIRKHALRYFSPSALVDLEKHQKLIETINPKMTRIDD